MTMTLSWTNLDNDVTDSCLLGHSGWIVLTSKTQFCQVPTHVGTTTTRDEINIKRVAEIFGWEYCVQHDRWLQS